MITQLDARPKRIGFGGTGTFLQTVRTRVDEHLADCPRSDVRLHRKGALIAVWFIASYGLLLTVRAGWVQLLLCLSYALAAAAWGFNLFHDANHGSFAASRRVNLLVSRLSCLVLGPGRYFWCHKHNALHHRFTNIFAWDDDIETRGHLRLSPRQPWQPKFKNQHRFFFVFYCLSTLEWLCTKDFVQYFTLRLNPYQGIPPMSRGDKWEFWVSKVAYYAVFVALPFAVLPPGRVVAGLLLFHVVLSLWLAFIFNLAHVTEKANFPVPSGSTATIEEEWAAHQLRTTVNFAPNNRLLNWFAGGLNFQIEHHLFPHLSHTHYPAISGIVRLTAQEFGLPYHCYETYFGSVTGHYRVLRECGKEPQGSEASQPVR
jgi:linoleoyl-CoA desaturase